jgi:hypothetical protein
MSTRVLLTGPPDTLVVVSFESSKGTAVPCGAW